MYVYMYIVCIILNFEKFDEIVDAFIVTFSVLAVSAAHDDEMPMNHSTRPVSMVSISFC